MDDGRQRLPTKAAALTRGEPSNKAIIQYTEIEENVREKTSVAFLILFLEIYLWRGLIAMADV
jgi:hypothetical protein